MVRRLLPIVALAMAAGACGEGEPQPDMKLHLQLEGAAPTATLFDVLVFGQAVSCSMVSANVATYEASPLCASASDDTSTTCHISHDQLPASGAGLINNIPPGTRTVFVEAFAASGPVGTGCAVATVKAGQAAAVTITVN